MKKQFKPKIFVLCFFKTLSRCEQITDEGVRYISSSISTQEKLRVLELDNCPTITDASIDHLFACQKLKRLEIFDCQQVTKNGIKKLQVYFAVLLFLNSNNFLL